VRSDAEEGGNRAAPEAAEWIAMWRPAGGVAHNP
jgi:hypothetical protein